MRTLHHRADRHRERLAAVLALVDAWARALALQLSDALAHYAAARADWTLWPENQFQMPTSCVVIMIDRIAEIDLGSRHNHTIPVSSSNIGIVAWYVNLINPAIPFDSSPTVAKKKSLRSNGAEKI